MAKTSPATDAQHDDSQLFMPDLERVRIALNALWEVESLARALGVRANELDASDLWIRGIAARLCDLASVGMSMLDDGMPQVVAEARKTLIPWRQANGQAAERAREGDAG